VFQFFGWDVMGFVVGMSPWAFAALVGVIIAVVLLFTSNIWTYGSVETLVGCHERGAEYTARISHNAFVRVGGSVSTS
jgi:hypothetical protein